MKPIALAVVLAVSLAEQTARAHAEEWTQWRGPRRDGVWSETGVLDRFDSDQISIKWRAAVAGGYSGPTVAAHRVYVTDRLEKPDEVERIHCFQWENGKSLWTHSYPCRYEGFGYRVGPRASVLVEGGRAHSLGAAGHLVCLDAAVGRVLWSRDLRSEYRIRMPNWGIAAAPLVEGELLIVQIGGEDEACLCAFDKKTGRPRWQALADGASYAAPIVIDQAGRRVLVCFTADRVVGLDLSNGALLWEYPVPWEKWPIGIATPVVHDDLLLVSDAHHGSLLFRLAQEQPGVKLVWHRHKKNVEKGAALHCLNSTPFIDGGHIFGADTRGVLRCLDLITGEQLWEDRSAVPEDTFATVHLIRNGQRTWLFNERGELIIARLTPAGYEELSRTKLIEPSPEQLPRRRGGVVWAHPAFAYRHVFARNDRELVCADLSAR